MRLGALFLLAFTGCLSTGASPLAAVDTTPPTILSFKPDLFSDASLPEIPVAGSLEITFSEAMDPGSLRPGIAVRNKGIDAPLNIQAPEAVKNLGDRDDAWTVKITAAASTGFEPGVSRLILRTLLIDAQGNALEVEGDQPEELFFFLVR